MELDKRYGDKNEDLELLSQAKKPYDRRKVGIDTYDLLLTQLRNINQPYEESKCSHV